jgi:large repetitive protein
MRSRRLTIGTLALVLALGCDSKGSEKAEGEGKTEVKAAASAEGAAKMQAKADVAAEVDVDAAAQADVDVDVDADLATAIAPQIGGTIVAAGDYHVEILAFVDGRIEAVVMDAKGVLVADMSTLAVVATLAAEGEANAKVELGWDAELARFVGEVEAGVQLVPGPVEVAVEVDGKASTGMLAELGLAVQASHGGQVMMAGAYSLEVLAKGGFVHVYAFDAGGKAHAEGDLDVDVELGGGGKLDLEWDPPSASYKAEVKGDLDLEAKPLVVEVRADGKLAMAAVASFHASAGGAAKGELDARVEVEPPSAKLDAKASAGASGKGSAKLESKSSSSASGKASAKVGGGGAKASIGGKAKAKGKIGFNLGG